MKIHIRPNPLPPFKPLYELPNDIWLVINVGGRGGGKSYEVSKYTLLQVIQNSKRCALLRDQQHTIAQSIMHEIKMRYDEINGKSGGYIASLYEMQDKGVKERRTGVMKIFTKGFQTSSNSQKASLKSIADVDIAIIEEFEDIHDEEKFNTFADSIRKENSLIIINSNVPHKNHWFVRRYFNLEESGHEGYYRLVPKNIPGVLYIMSSYKDNAFLPEKTIKRYESYGDPASPFYNLPHYCTDILGLVSESVKGRIYKGWKHITTEFFNSLPYPSDYGLDFGYSEDPVALVEIKSHNNRNFWREVIYEKGLTNPALAKRMEARGVSKKAVIYADSAEPKSIKELGDLGFNVQEAEKGPDSLLFGIKMLQSMENYATEDSENLWKENEEYLWELDAEKNPTDKPMDKMNHLKDAGRYAITTKKGKARKKKIKIANPQQGVESPLDWV